MSTEKITVGPFQYLGSLKQFRTCSLVVVPFRNDRMVGGLKCKRVR